MSTNPFLAAAGIAPPPTDIGSLASDAEQRYGLPAGVMKGLIHVESGGNIHAVSPQGAQGVVQLLPSTARALGADPNDPSSAIDAGARYLKEGIDKTGSLQGGLMYYHGGPDQSGWGPKTQAYPGQVLAAMGSQTEGGDPTAASGPNPFLDALNAAPDAPTPQATPQAAPQAATEQPVPGMDGWTLSPDQSKTGDYFADSPDHKRTVNIGKDPSNPSPPTDEMLGLKQGFSRSMDNAAVFVDNGLKKVGVNLDSFDHALGSNTPQEARNADLAYFADQEKQGNIPGKIGDFVGTLPVGLAAAALTKNPWAGGALTGALDTSNPNSLATTGRDAAIGSVAGKLGSALMGGVSNVIAPKVSDAAKLLASKGVDLTPGQLVGGSLKRVEDGLTSVPLLGDLIKNAQRRGLESFNTSAIQQTLDPIGAKLPDIGAKSGYDAVEYADKALSNAYNQLLPKLTVKADQPFVNGLSQIFQASRDLPTDKASQFRSIIKNSVQSQFDSTGSMSGQTFKQVDSKLGQLARTYGSSQDPEQRLMANAFRDVQGEFRDLVERSNPAYQGQLKAINTGFAKLVRVEKAASSQAATGGVFTPQQFSGAVRSADSSARKKASATGNALMQDFAQAGREVLPSSVPDSGTPLRSMLAGAGGAAAAGNAGLMGAALLKAAPAAIPLAAYTKTGGRIVSGAILKRPAAAKALGEALAKLKAPASVAATGLAVSKAEGR